MTDSHLSRAGSESRDVESCKSKEKTAGDVSKGRRALKTSGLAKQYLAVGASSFGFFAISVTYCWITPELARITSGRSVVTGTRWEVAGLPVSAEVGVVVLAIPVAGLANRFGRRALLLATGPLTTLSWLVVYFTHNMIVLLLMRFIQGVMLGVFMGVLPMYAAETASDAVRGAISSLLSISWSLGFLYASIIGPTLSYDLHLLLTCLPITIYPLIFMWFSETPHYLLYMGKEEEARKSLQSFRDGDIELEFQSIKTFIASEADSKSSGWKELISNDKSRSVLVTLLFMNLEVAVINTQVTFLSRESLLFHRGFYSTYLPSIIYGCASLFLNCFINRLIDSVGRKALIVVPSTINGTLLLVVSIYCYLDVETSIEVERYWMVAACCNVLGLLATCLGTNTAIRVYQSELFTTSARSFGCAVINIEGAVITCFIFYLFEYCIADNKSFVGFSLLSSMSFIGAFCTWLYAPETKGKTFQEIQDML